jgi:hypothetical protein
MRQPRVQSTGMYHRNVCVCVFLIITRIRSSHTARSYRKGYRASY